MHTLLLALSLLASPAPKKPLAYYCASGNTVKYHTSSTCYGLRHCNARVLPLPLGKAQARMQPCQVCH